MTLGGNSTALKNPIEETKANAHFSSSSNELTRYTGNNQKNNNNNPTLPTYQNEPDKFDDIDEFMQRTINLTDRRRIVYLLRADGFPRSAPTPPPTPPPPRWAGAGETSFWGGGGATNFFLLKVKLNYIMEYSGSSPD